MPFVQFFVGPFLGWLPKIFFGAVFLGVAALYFWRRDERLASRYKQLIAAAIVFRVVYASLLMVAQYYVWAQNRFTQILLDTPLDRTLEPILKSWFLIFQTPSGYFFFYSFIHFWVNVLFSVAAAFLFYLFLRSLKKYRERFFDYGEVELGFLAALLAGWPHFVPFLIFAFFLVVIVSLFRRITLGELYTTLGLPFLLAALIVLVWGDPLVQLFRLTVLKI